VEFGVEGLVEPSGGLPVVAGGEAVAVDHWVIG
jgi:hypothetical protein